MRKVKTIAKLNPYFNEYDYEFFKDALNYFSKYIDKKVYVKGYNLTWDKKNGTKSFIFSNIEQILTELVNTDTDFSFEISKTRGRNTYKARSSNHDCTSNYLISFRNTDEIKIYDDRKQEIRDMPQKTTTFEDKDNAMVIDDIGQMYDPTNIKERNIELQNKDYNKVAQLNKEV